MVKEQRGGSRAGKGAGGREIVLALDRRIFYGGLILLGLVGVFLLGVWLGKGPSQTASIQQPGLSAAVEAEDSSSMAVVTKQLPKGMDPNLMGYTPADPDAPLEGDRPRIAVPGLGPNHTYDLGVIPADRSTEHVFVIKNIGNADLEIYEVGTSCACAASVLSDKVVPPGGETELKFTYDPTMYDEHGLIEKYVQIFSNDPAGREGEIRFKVIATVQ
ncbi:MAG TPA: DUF1573 domain-containing protein [Anaerolineae bacterium]|nr:DUF1573 domain-containing protein [Anaerolineae bacterium]